MGALSRNKGVRSEQAVARRYRAQNFVCARTSRGETQTGIGDLGVEGIAGVHVEVKCAAALRIVEWLEQTAREAPPACIPALHFRLSSRRKQTDWFVAVPLDDWIGVLKEARGI